MAEPDRKPLSTLGRGSDWVNLWRKRDGEWVSFIGRIAADGAVEYQSGAERSIHNTVTHWSPLTPAPEPTTDAVSDERLRDCPFCGGANIFVQNAGWQANTFMRCPDCRTTFSLDNGTPRSHADTVAAWNRRSITSQASEGAVTVPASELLAVRDALMADDLNDAWHHLYTIADPEFCQMEPWRNLEHKAAASPSKRVERLETDAREARRTAIDEAALIAKYGMDRAQRDYRTESPHSDAYRMAEEIYEAIQALQGGGPLMTTLDQRAQAIWDAVEARIDAAPIDGMSAEGEYSETIFNGQRLYVDGLRGGRLAAIRALSSIPEQGVHAHINVGLDGTVRWPNGDPAALSDHFPDLGNMVVPPSQPAAFDRERFLQDDSGLPSRVAPSHPAAVGEQQEDLVLLLNKLNWLVNQWDTEEAYTDFMREVEPIAEKLRAALVHRDQVKL